MSGSKWPIARYTVDAGVPSRYSITSSCLHLRIHILPAAESLSLRNFDFRIHTLYTCLDFGFAFGIARLAIDAACPAAAIIVV